ncbi:MAG TPA: HD-GYP domain-containing protein [Patescibacteria group bacterium]|nr:HD-GYP domain-containing protein [Patescibacteria group bacterium]
MYRITIDNLRPKMMSTRPIYDTAGRKIIPAGLKLEEAELRRLRSMGIGSLYVWSPFLAQETEKGLISETTRLQAARTVWLTYLSVSLDKAGEGFGLEEVAKEIVREVKESGNLLIQSCDVRAYGDYLYYHVVNVAALAAKIGISMGYNEGQLLELVQGALLHDVGEMMLSQELMEKTGKLTAEEHLEIRKHPERGFAYLRKAMPQLTAPTAFAVLQHHERIDGRGYPWQLKETEIVEYARILAVADIFDALTADRPFRAHVPFHEACRLLRALRGKLFDGDLVDLLLPVIAPYPLGTLVRIANGKVGVVTQLREGENERPRVRLFMNRQGGLLAKEQEIILGEEPELEMYRVLPENAAIPIANLYTKKRHSASVLAKKTVALERVEE